MTVEVIADSINIYGNRITTMVLCYPRMIHSEFMTHRVFSRNARSSRAVPVQKMIDEVRHGAAMPVAWGANEPGMQANSDLTPDAMMRAKIVWLKAARDAADHAEAIMNIGAHKQIANRILEPFTFIDVIVTSTEWQNFFDLRCHSAADPTIRALAEEMRAARDASIPEATDVHRPFSSDLKVSVAVCARVTHGRSAGTSLEADRALHDRLAAMKHWSPFEHQARALPGDQWCRNFKGWMPYRAEIDGL